VLPGTAQPSRAEDNNAGQARNPNASRSADRKPQQNQHEPSSTTHDPTAPRPRPGGPHRSHPHGTLHMPGRPIRTPPLRLELGGSQRSSPTSKSTQHDPSPCVTTRACTTRAPRPVHGYPSGCAASPPTPPLHQVSATSDEQVQIRARATGPVARLTPTRNNAKSPHTTESFPPPGPRRAGDDADRRQQRNRRQWRRHRPIAHVPVTATRCTQHILDVTHSYARGAPYAEV